MVKRLFIFVSIVVSSLVKAQCPQIYDYLGNLSANPQFINCSGGSYNLNFAAGSNFGAYTINWGDGSPNTVGASYVANTNIPHVYAATINTFVLTLNIPSASCTRTALVVMEQPVFAGLTVAGGASLACAPKTLTFNNASTFASATTSFTYDFGDGTPTVVYSYTNAGQQVTHTYAKGSVNCQTQVILQAKNYCSFGIVSNGIVNPLLVYDVDNAAITADKFIRCWPDNIFTFNNSTARNCLPQGNTFQRQEWWNFGNFWGLGHDSIINWKPWPPTTPHSVAYPSVGSYSIMLRDSNLCGVDTSIISVSIVNPPVAGLLAPPGNLCQNSPITFTNSSAPGYFYLWNFGTGGGFTNLGTGNKIFTFPNPGTFTVKVVAYIPGSGSYCSDTANAVVTIFATPVANFSVNPTVGCNSISSATFTDFSTGAVAWNWTFANGNTSTLQVPPAQNYTLIGSFTASLVVTASTSCVNTKTTSIIVRPKPVPIFPVISSCVGSAANFSSTSTVSGTNAINSYTWNFGDGTANSNIQNPAHTYTAPSTYTVKLIVATAFCKDSITHAINVNIKPTANFAFTPTISCPPFSVTFTNNSINATNTFWSFGTIPTSTSSLVNPSFTYTNSSQSFQNFTVTLISSTGAGCSDTIKKGLTVRPRPVTSFTPTLIGNGCSPVPATFSNSTIGATTYSWNFGDGFSSTSLNPNHTFTNSTLVLQTMTISLVATNSVGCSDTTSRTLQIFPKPFTSFTMIPTSGCTPLLISFPPVPGVVTYTWNFGDGTPVVVANSPTTHVFSNTTLLNHTYTVTLIAQNGFGCTDSNLGYALIYPKPVPNFAFSSTVGCSPFNAVIANTSTLSNSNLWKFGDGQTANTSNASHTYSNTSGGLTNQTYSCTLVTTSFYGCKDSITKPLLVYYKPHASFAIDTPKCASSTISFTNNSTGSISYLWNYGDASPTSTALSVSHSYTNNGINNASYVVTLIAISPSSCKDTTTRNAIVYARPSASFAISPTVGCSPLTTTMLTSSSNAHSYKWKFGDGSFSTQTGEVHTYTNSSSTTNQTVNCTLVAYNNNGCRDSISAPLTLFYKPKASFTADTPACSPKIIHFANTSIGANLYHWSFGDGSVSTSSAPAHQYVSTFANQVFTVNFTATSSNNCTDSILVPIKIYPKPKFIISAAPDSGCTSLKVKFNSIVGVSQYQWKFDDGNGSNSGNVSNTFINNGTATKIFTVQLFAKDIHGCADTPTKIIKVYPKPTAKFSANPLTVYVPNQATQFTNLSTSAASYTWSFGDGASSKDYSPSHAYAKAGEYDIRLIVTNNRGCKDTFDLPEKVIALDETTILVPNAFKPNTSGSPGNIYDPMDLSNNIFHPNVRGADKYQLSIYSRWGELLFDTKNPLEGWDGYYKGKLCTQDVYVWKVVATFVDGKSYNKTGDVLLLR